MICAEILEEVSEYTQAIRKSCEILERYGMVTGEYYRGIIDNIGEYGGYFYLGEGVCMPHAKPKTGVLSTGLCIIKLNTPVDFEGKKVRIFFTLAARDEAAHFVLMKQIAEICSKKQSLKKMLECRSSEEMLMMMEEEQ